MANALGTLFQNIASAIRAKTGETGTMKPAEFPDKIAAIETGGGSDVEIVDDVAIVPNFSSGNHTIDLTEAKQAIRTGYVEKPSTLIPSNIKTGVTIAGVTGTLEASKSTGVNFYGMTYSNMQYTISDSVTMASGPGNMSSVVLSSVPSTVTHIVAIPDDGYEYTKGCAWDWLGGHWIYDYRIHTNETFEVPYSGTLQSYSAPSCLTFVSDSGSSLKFRGSSSEGNGNLQVNTSAYNNSYKIIVG